MKNKGLKILIVAAIAVALIMAGVILVKESGMDTSKIVEVHLEVINDEGSIERIQVTEADDVEAIKVAFNAETESEGASLFTEGGYRIIMAQPDKEWHLYPAGGELDMVRVGDTGDKFIMTDDVAELERIIGKYIDISDYKGNYDWKTVIMEDIKN